jgi:hypothetical protein
MPPFPLWVPFCNLSSNSAILHSYDMAIPSSFAVPLFPVICLSSFPFLF